MKQVISLVCLLLSVVILTGNTVFAYPRNYSEEKTVVVVPSAQARFAGVDIKV